jgi:hypothetical protein
VSDAWAVVVAGLGGSALTGLVAWGLGERQAAQSRRERQQQERRKAYSELLGHSTQVLQLAAALHQTMAARSGLVEGIDVALHHRKPMDPWELWLSMQGAVAPLNLAWSDVWTVGSSDGIRLANALIDRCADVISTATSRGEGRGGLAQRVAGEKWTQEQLDAWDADQKALARARRDLALHARHELGFEVAEVFREPPKGD